MWKSAPGACGVKLTHQEEAMRLAGWMGLAGAEKQSKRRYNPEQAIEEQSYKRVVPGTSACTYDIDTLRYVN